MARAVWKGTVLAESEEYEVVEGNIYFPSDAVKWDYFRNSDTHTVCGWKGTASYYTVVVNGDENPDAAWYYPDPKPEAGHIKNKVAFWHGVQVEQ